MYNIFSQTENPSFNPSLCLSRIWNVSASKSYIAYKLKEYKPKLVAIRTITGQGKLHLNNIGIKTLNQNSLIIFNYDDVIKYGTFKDSWDFYWIEFNTKDIELNFNNVIDIQISKQELFQLQNCFNLLNALNSEKLCSSLFLFILLEWKYKADNKIYLEDPINNAIIDITKKSDIKISVKALAEKYNFSERQFLNVFKEKTGKTPKEFILNHILMTAYELLTTTNNSIKYISLSLGFENQYYFSRVFRNKFGICPKLARLNIK